MSDDTNSDWKRIAAGCRVMATATLERHIPRMLPPRWTRLWHHGTQRELWSSGARFRVCPAGRRSGKTELAKVIAEEFFGKDSALLHLDLAEYNLEGSVNKLIGAPLGYTGSDQEGILTKWLHRTGSGVILFDEIEKAHNDIHNLLLGLLDNGRITSSSGEGFDATQCVIIITTNAVKQTDMSRQIVGFCEICSSPDHEELLSAHFPREFLGRLDDAILFNTLKEGDLKKIILLRLEEAFEKLARKNISISFDPNKTSEFLVKFLKENKKGARGVERLVEKKVLQPISMIMLDYDNKGNAVIELDDKFYTTGEISKRI